MCIDMLQKTSFYFKRYNWDRLVISYWGKLVKLFGKCTKHSDSDIDFEIDETDYVIDNINYHSLQEDLPEIIEGGLLVVKVGGKKRIAKYIIIIDIVKADGDRNKY